MYFSTSIKSVVSSFISVFITLIIFISETKSQNLVTWVGGISTDYFNAKNWSDTTLVFSNMNNNHLTIGAGSPNACSLVGGNSSNVAYRPGKLNVASNGIFTCNGAVYPNNSDSLNGTVIINAVADFNNRNILYIGNKANCNLTINGGKLTSKNGTLMATGTGGSATVTLNGGSLTVGSGGANMDLTIANATGLTAQLNINGGAVTVARNLLIGTGGRINITGIGYLKVAGDKRVQLNGLITDGRLTCTAAKTLSVTYDGTNTIAAIPRNGNSMITEYPDSVVLKTGNLVCVVEKSSGNILSYRFKGVETVANKPSNTKKYMYHDFTTSYGFETIWGATYEVVEDTTDFAHIVIKRPYTPSIGHFTPCDAELHYALKKDDNAVYVYSKLEHKPNYPKFDIGSWRQVWWIAYDANGVNLCERIYTDSLRSWQMPSNYDYSQGVGSNGPQEIIRLTTGVRAGKLDGKYQYSVKFWDTPLWGHASNINNIGSWCVNTSCEYYNEGPMYHELNAAAGIIHQCMNGVHYGAGGIFADTLTSWIKVFGPYLLLITDKSTGDSNWLAAKQRQEQEKALWPYSWVKDTVAYPKANARGTVSGKYVIVDVLKPNQTAANAWVGVTNLDDGAVGFQFECKDYQYWVRADANGNFSIPNIRPGTYSLFAFVDGVVGEYRLDNVVVTAGNTTTVGTLTNTVNRTYGNLLWEIGTPDRTAQEFKMGDFDYSEGNIQFKFRDSFPNTIEYTVANNNYSKVLPYAHTRYPDTAAVPNIGDSWKWRLKFNLPAGFSTSGNARLTIAFASTDHAQEWIYVNNENSLFTSFYPDYGDGNAFLRQTNYAKYSYKQILIPMNKFIVGANTITLVMPSGSGWVSHHMYDYISLEANVAVLPVTLLSFTANKLNSNTAINLKWVTTSEINSSFFEVEKSADAIVFSAIGKVAAKATTNATTNYTFIDNYPLNGNNYYRLKQVDVDGKYVYSETRLVSNNSVNSQLVIYPNPAKNFVVIKTNEVIETIEIIDAAGKVQITKVNVGSKEIRVDVSKLATGTYVVKAKSGSKCSTEYFAK
ncbi:MAG: polysaccharide lyase family protein [Flavobacterium sp.]|nr:polysaccharide lyase family protein [Flavobacterium sp.]